MDDCTVSLCTRCGCICIIVPSPTERLFLPFLSFTLCRCKSNTEFSKSSSPLFLFSRRASIHSPLLHSSPSSFSFSPLQPFYYYHQHFHPHFLEAHLKSLIVGLSLCRTQRIIKSTGAASRSFSLLCWLCVCVLCISGCCTGFISLQSSTYLKAVLWEL